MELAAWIYDENVNQQHFIIAAYMKNSFVVEYCSFSSVQDMPSNLIERSGKLKACEKVSGIQLVDTRVRSCPLIGGNPQR